MNEVTDFIAERARMVRAFLTDNPTVFMLVMFGLVALLTWLGL